MGALLKFEQQLVTETCVTCGCVFGFPGELQRHLIASKHTYYCPSGHGQHYTEETEAEKLRKQLAAEQASKEWHRQRAEHLDKQLASQRGVNTKLKKRVSSGVCPCCKRTFSQLARHMAGQHPGYAEQKPGAAGVLPEGSE